MPCPLSGGGKIVAGRTGSGVGASEFGRGCYRRDSSPSAGLAMARSGCGTGVETALEFVPKLLETQRPAPGQMGYWRTLAVAALC
jgi:hypothetical protein